MGAFMASNVTGAKHKGSLQAPQPRSDGHMTATIQEVEQAELLARQRRAETALLATQAEKLEAEARLLRAQECKRMLEREARCGWCGPAASIGALALVSLLTGALAGYAFQSRPPALIIVQLPVQPVPTK